MGLFTRSKKEYDLLNRTVECFEKSQQNTELLVQSIYETVEMQKKEQNALGEFKDKEDEEFKKRQAAYALNLCTVSVSQIVDYDDINILEQEYEMILNNLNLENIPKDEALLNILKQLLDTITFFRIQEGDKKFIEKEYQQKMKNAIWSAVPNFGLIVAGGNPITMAVSLASQIGIGYMNYRKTKAENSLEKEKQEWQLQRAAIEQFNGLRRELFDTSWRLADKYDFPDEYRLTERQIEQYNKILMDNNILRKYERLESIQNYFEAYPTFWYYFGHAANQIAQDALLKSDVDIYRKYQKLAIEHFDKYIKNNKYALLREDQIASSCALEYIDLLDETKDREKIKGLIQIAEKSSGRACDILQICAISYLRIGETKLAVNVLKYLVNEKYNDITNAQLLSSIYVSDYLQNKNETDGADYKLLFGRGYKELLFPFPQSENDNLDTLKKRFVDKQRQVIMDEYVYVISSYIQKMQIKFNQCIPVPDETKNYPYSFFLDDRLNRENRLSAYTTIFNNDNKRQEFIDKLANSDFANAYLEVLNKIVNDMRMVTIGDAKTRNDVIQVLADNIEQKIIARKEIMIRMQEKMNDKFSIIDFEKIYELSFGLFTEEFFNTHGHITNADIEKFENMGEFSSYDNKLRQFCVKHQLPEPVIEYIDGADTISDDEEKCYFSSEILGGKAYERSQNVKLVRRMADVINEYASEIASSEKVKWINHIHSKNVHFEAYFNKKKYATQERKNSISAILIDDSGIGKSDLVFTTQGIIVNTVFTSLKSEPKIVPYNNVSYDDSVLKIGEEKYKSEVVNLGRLYDLIQELSEIVASRKEKPDTDYVTIENKGTTYYLE